MATNVEEPWSPEPELREQPPRRLRASEYPDLTAPNIVVFLAVAIIFLAAGGGGIFLGLQQKNSLFQILGAAALVVGVLSLIMPGIKASRAKARAERLVRDGTPIMARIVTAANLTGDSTHGRLVTYMVNLPGGEIARRDVAADERALPRRIPANVTALLDPNNLRDVELYCALPLRAIARPAPARDPLADLPMEMTAGPATPTIDSLPDIPMVTPNTARPAAAATAATPAPPPAPTAENLPDLPFAPTASDDHLLGTNNAEPLPEPAPAEEPTEEEKKEEKAEPAQPQPKKSGYQGLPWE